MTQRDFKSTLESPRPGPREPDYLPLPKYGSWTTLDKITQVTAAVTFVCDLLLTHLTLLSLASSPLASPLFHQMLKA